jgi:pilus assembly protein CpaC
MGMETMNSTGACRRSGRRFRRRALALAAACAWALSLAAAASAAQSPSDPGAQSAATSAEARVDARVEATIEAPVEAPAALRPDAPTDVHAEPPAPTSAAAPSPSPTATANTSVQLLVNKSLVLDTKVAYKRVNLGQPEVADVNLLGSGSLLLTGKKAGSTQLIVWDDTDHAQVMDITVQVDVAGLQDQVKSLFPTLKLDVRAVNGTVAIRGTVPSLTVADQVLQVARPYAKDVLNLMEISGGQQVMLQVRFAEVSRTATSQLGINAAVISGGWAAGNNVGGINPTTFLPVSGVVGNTPPPNSFSLNGSPGVSPAVTLYSSGQIGSVFLENFIAALKQNNLLRVLAEPNLLTLSGQEASFLAGGKFPIPITQGGTTGAAAISIEYEEYGVKLKFIPVVLGDGRIRLKVTPEVSDLDYANGVTISGFRIPGITQRTVTTTVELSEGQTFAVAGLLNNSVSAGKDAVPLLGELPVVGPLFRSVRYQRKETELVVLVTPRLVAPMNPVDVPQLPGETWRHPTEADLFWSADLGGPAADTKHAPALRPGERRSAPRFHGQYGFVPVAERSDRIVSTDR